MTTAINFVYNDEANQEKLDKTRRTVITITTGILAAYLIAIAGLFGWWWYWLSKENKTTKEIDALVAQISNYSDEEVAVRRLDSRAKMVNDFLLNRGDASGAARILDGASNVEITLWKYDFSGTAQVGIKAADPEQIFTFTTYLKDKYVNVQPDEVGWNVNDGWNARILLSGKKRGSV